MERRLYPIMIALAATLPAYGQQWSVVVLHPAGASASQVYSVTATQQGGTCDFPGASRGGIWAGNAESWRPLTPSGVQGGVYGIDNAQQVGVVSGRATLWQGTPESAVSLHPANWVTSYAGHVRAGVQAGGGTITYGPPEVTHCGIWHGTPGSFDDLHPPGALLSSLSTTDEEMQGGIVHWPFGQSSSIERAAVWRGTPESVVDIGQNRTSQVNAMASGVQVGRVQFLGGAHAAVWHGTPESFTDLNPPGMTGGTFFYGTTGRVHVGRGFFDDSHLARAAINFNTTDSWMSLHQFLPERYTSFSTATSVCQDGDTLYVGGQAVNSLTGQYEAILWTGILVCYANCDASATSPALDLADFVCFLQRFNEGDGYANCDHSTTPPVLNVADFTCFLRRFAEGCP